MKVIQMIAWAAKRQEEREREWGIREDNSQFYHDLQLSCFLKFSPHRRDPGK